MLAFHEITVQQEPFNATGVALPSIVTQQLIGSSMSQMLEPPGMAQCQVQRVKIVFKAHQLYVTF